MGWRLQLALLAGLAAALPSGAWVPQLPPCMGPRARGGPGGLSRAGQGGLVRCAMAATPLAGGQLYLDQAAAMARRGEQERAWLEPLSAELIAPVLSAKAKKKSAAAGSAGGGFGKAAPKQTQSAADVLAPLLAGVLQKEGVVRVDGALSPATAKAALEYVLAERSASLARVADGSARAQDCFGVELERGGGLRHDLLLPLAPLAQPLGAPSSPYLRKGIEMYAQK
ncbi:hypothetical protein T484DRAFT_1754893 [Baffinella frigidus]|nr:hypothetical protein T484DRAFT_1754893 [Cryptophyta sp. CCMP2293]